MYTLSHTSRRQVNVYQLAETDGPSSETTDRNSLLSIDAQARVAATVDAAMKVLESNPEVGNAIRNMFGDMIQQNLCNPDMVNKLLAGLKEKHEQAMKNIPEAERNNAQERYNDFLTKFSLNTAHMAHNIAWDNEIRALAQQFDLKRGSVTFTYGHILRKHRAESTPSQ